MKDLLYCLAQDSRYGSGLRQLNLLVADRLANQGLPDYYTPLGNLGLLPPRKVMPEVKLTVLETLVNDDAVAEAHTTLVVVRLFYDWNWLAAEKEFKRALELTPDDATSHHLYAFYLAAMARLDEAIVAVKRAQEIDPGSLVINTGAGWILYFTRRYDQAIEQIRKTLESGPYSGEAHTILRLAYEKTGRYQEALADWQEQMVLIGKRELAHSLDNVYKISGYQGVLLLLLQRAEKASKHTYLPPAIFFFFHARLGSVAFRTADHHKNQALKWLAKAFEERCSYLPFLKVDPLFDSLRGDSRFEDLARRVGFDRLSCDYDHVLHRPFLATAESHEKALNPCVTSEREHSSTPYINNFVCHF